MIRFEGKVAVVTGGYGGIGASVCRGWAELGQRLWSSVTMADANLKSAMFQIQAASRHRIAQGRGKQVHLCLAILCTQLAAEWAPHKKINVNVVAPTFVRTDLIAHVLADPNVYRVLVGRIPLGRIDFVAGQALYLDGGITATR